MAHRGKSLGTTALLQGEARNEALKKIKLENQQQRQECQIVQTQETSITRATYEIRRFRKKNWSATFAKQISMKFDYVNKTFLFCVCVLTPLKLLDVRAWNLIRLITTTR